MYDKTSFLSGLTMGLCTKGDPTFKVNKNVLYNGVELPDINTVWTDKTTYPYAYISSLDGFDYVLILTTSRAAYNENSITAVFSNWVSYTIELDSWRFVRKDYASALMIGTDSEPCVWCSADVLYAASAAVYLAASEPVPATDTFTKGYLVGAELRRKRILTKKYLYNGVQLPKLPKTDADYAVIAYYAPLDTYRLVYCNVRPCYITQRYAGDTPNPKIGLSEYYAGYLKRSDSNVWEFDDTPVGAFTLSIWTPIWTNCDILADDGSVYMAAGTTNDRNVPTPPPDPQPICADKSINYLFGETELPALPDFDIRVYPYVMWSGDLTSTHGIMIASRIPTTDKVSSTGTVSSPYYAINVIINFADAIPAWDEWEVINGLYGLNDVSWANYNILNEDGSVYLAASDPVPVYE